ncbi:MAG: hypothetical protein ACI9LO_001367 [Planctomycetota bacterium]
MPKTLLIQSHRHPLPFQWIESCLESVKNWSEQRGFDYRFLGDELFDPVPELLMQKTAGQHVIASDLARLFQLQQGLRDGYDTVLWCDADFLIFNAPEFNLCGSDYALGREVWVQRDDQGKLRAFSKVHNAFLMFRKGNSFLDFYCDSAQRLLTGMQAGMPPQFIGPKLLTAIHNIVQCHVMESAGMLSPLVMRDLIAGEGEALELFRRKSPAPLAGANLCSSLSVAEAFSEQDMAKLMDSLLDNGAC